MIAGLDFTVIKDNLVYFFIGRYPGGPLGGVALTLYLAVASLVLSSVITLLVNFYGRRVLQPMRGR